MSVIIQKVNKIHQLIEMQAVKNPQKIAISLNDKKISYEELNNKANQFARYLIDNKVKSGDIVPIIAQKSPQLFIVILGILKAGAAYSPMNVGNPDKHIHCVIKETRAKIICTEVSLIDRFKLDLPTVILNNIDDLINSYSAEKIEDSNESDLAYVVYTSGTTGNPKGTMISHANLLSTYHSWEEAYQLTNADIHLQMAPIGFDVFAGDWIRALCSGSTLVLCPKNILLDPQQLYQLIESEKINCAEFVPAILRQLINYVVDKGYDLSQFRLLICGSDQWFMGEYRAVKKLCGKNTRVISSYGLTETTIDSSFYEENETSHLLDNSSIVPIGKAFKHVKIYLLNENGTEVSTDETGEIYIGGLGVGLGYLNQPELTEDKFVTKTFPDGTKARIYKTGDQGSISADGNFLFLGRNQEHIKINGKRVDLITLEAVINKHPKIKFCIVIPAEKIETNDISLQCFFIAKDDSLSLSEISNHIRHELPYYYVPNKFYQVAKIPLSANGKVDKRISSQKIIKELKSEYQPPQNGLQEYLISLWGEILHVERVGINDTFYSLGGSSLSQVMMINKINTQFNINIAPNINFETIEDLAKHIEMEALYLANKKNLTDNNFISILK